MNLVEHWLRRDRVRWMAGALAGLFAGVCMIVFAMIVSMILGQDAFLPVKIAAIPFLGAEATAIGSVSGVIVGIVFLEILGAFLGAVFAHFAYTNHLGSLLGMGFTWGAFSWIFLSNLFFQSFPLVRATQYSPGVAFFVLMVFGFALTSVAFFDRMLRGSRRS